MKKASLKKWLKALRSGKYKNIAGALRTEDGFCALGVLCDISKVSKWKPPRKDSTKMQYLGQSKYLPKEVAEWAGMSERESGSLGAFLIIYNDQVKLSFPELADMLQKNYKPRQKDEVTNQKKSDGE